MTDSKLKLSETTWRIVGHEERGVGGRTFAHLTMRCCRCDSATAIVVPAWPGSTVLQQEPTVEPCPCVAAAIEQERFRAAKENK